MGVDIYMRWEGFGEENLNNINYKNQITGFMNNGRCGYLRIAYSNPDYEVLSESLFWDWDKDIDFTLRYIKLFKELIKKFPEKLEEEKEEWLKFAELGEYLNKVGKKPKIHISY